MSNGLAPKLKKISVSWDRLVLDPNNPRFITRKQDRIAEEHYLDQDTVGATKLKMLPEKQKDPYKIHELIESITQNGWLPVDAIFVRKLQGDDKRYVVLEGNRRITAIRVIMSNTESAASLKEKLLTIEVMEVLDSGSTGELQKKISYLLGVRHHGSLKRWTPFAQAHNIYDRYLEVAEQTPEDFKWVNEYGQKVANTLSITLDDVEERLKVYRVMIQIAGSPEVTGSTEKMKDRYYSICAEPLLSPRKQLGSYIHQDPLTFLLDNEAVERMNNLCHFAVANRDQSPLPNPTEWSYFDKILADEDAEIREENLRKVEKDKNLPSIVWAERSKELAKLTWEKWLLEVNSILKLVTLSDLTDTKAATPTVEKLLSLIVLLKQRDIH